MQPISSEIAIVPGNRTSPVAIHASVPEHPRLGEILPTETLSLQKDNLFGRLFPTKLPQ